MCFSSGREWGVLQFWERVGCASVLGENGVCFSGREFEGWHASVGGSGKCFSGRESVVSVLQFWEGVMSFSSGREW